jgi:hypothetical protein
VESWCGFDLHFFYGQRWWEIFLKNEVLNSNTSVVNIKNRTENREVHWIDCFRQWSMSHHNVHL